MQTESVHTVSRMGEAGAALAFQAGCWCEDSSDDDAASCERVMRNMCERDYSEHVVLHKEVERRLPSTQAPARRAVRGVPTLVSVSGYASL